MLRNYLATTSRKLTRNNTLALIYLFGLGIYRVYPHILMNGNNFTSSMAPPQQK